VIVQSLARPLAAYTNKLPGLRVGSATGKSILNLKNKNKKCFKRPDGVLVVAQYESLTDPLLSYLVVLSTVAILFGCGCPVDVGSNPVFLCLVWLKGAFTIEDSVHTVPELDQMLVFH
jgi:hypothetical protein